MSETCSAEKTVSNPPSRPSSGRSNGGSLLPSQSRTVFSYSNLVRRFSGTVPGAYAPPFGLPPPPGPAPPLDGSDGPPVPPLLPMSPEQAASPTASAASVNFLIGNIDSSHQGESRNGWPSGWPAVRVLVYGPPRGERTGRTRSARDSSLAQYS